MRANEFVKKFGWDRAKREVALIGTIAAMCCDSGFNNDLKRLVESWELVESYSGLDESKRYVEKLISASTRQFGLVFVGTLDKVDEINQAIKDVESCQ